MAVRRVGKYEIGRTIGQGTYAKVKFAQNIETGESVALKIIDRSTILGKRMVEQMKREITILKTVRSPYVVRLHEVLATRNKIYIIMEYVTGGELFDKIANCRRVSENQARKYFQQLIDGIDFCHSKGVYHRDLKPENILLDSQGNLKISDFGLGAQPPEGVTILKTTCGTPNYVAPEVLSTRGYDGALADIWSCGVILYVLLAGYLPFVDVDLTNLYCKIEAGDYKFPAWFSAGARSLIKRILDPNPQTRIRAKDIKNHEWFKKDYYPVRFVETEEVYLHDINSVFDATEDLRDDNAGPLILNAFDLFILSQGLNLETLFDGGKDTIKLQTRFVSEKPAKVVLSTMELIAQSLGYKTKIRNYKMRIEALSANRAENVTAILEVFEVTPTFMMVDVQRAAGGVEEYLNFYKKFCANLVDIIWKPPEEAGPSTSKSRRRQ